MVFTCPSNLYSILTVANLLAYNNISQICYCGQISLQSAAVNCIFSDNQTPSGVTYILLAMIPLRWFFSIEKGKMFSTQKRHHFFRHLLICTFFLDTLFRNRRTKTQHKPPHNREAPIVIVVLSRLIPATLLKTSLLPQCRPQSALSKIFSKSLSHTKTQSASGKSGYKYNIPVYN